MRFKLSKRRGFTLVEILVTVAILAVLGALSMAAIRSSINSSHITASQHNLKQMGVAMHAFASENNGYFPPVTTNLTGGTYGTFWDEALADYLGGRNDVTMKREIFICPASVIEVADMGTWTPITYSANQYVLGYYEEAPNGTINIGAIAPTKPNRLRDPAKTIIVATGAQSEPKGGSQRAVWRPYSFPGDLDAQVDTPIPFTNDDSLGGSIRYRLNNKAGVLMADGHVELLGEGEITWGNYHPYTH